MAEGAGPRQRWAQPPTPGRPGKVTVPDSVKQPYVHSDELLGDMVPRPWTRVAPSMTAVIDLSFG